MSIEKTSADDSSKSLKARHYGSHRNLLLYGGFLESTCTYHKESSSISEKSIDGTCSLCQQCDDDRCEAAANDSDGGIALKR